GGALVVGRAMEIGHIFKLGYKYSKSMRATVLDKDGKEVTPIMGSYGIGVERILTAAIEQNNDADGFWLPRSIAPFDVVVTPTNVSDAGLLSVAEDIAQKLEAAGFQVLLDDRDERPGVKFKDADLVGIPYRINVGKKVTEGKVEVVTRSTRQSQDANIGAIEAQCKEILRSSRRRMNAGTEKLKVVIFLAVVAASIYVAWNLIPPYFHNAQFQDDLDDIVRRATYSTISDDDLKQVVIRKAQSMDIILKEDQITIARSSMGVTISVAYQVHVDMIVHPVDLKFIANSHNKVVGT